MCCMFAALVVLCIVLSDGEDMKDQKNVFITNKYFQFILCNNEVCLNLFWKSWM